MSEGVTARTALAFVGGNAGSFFASGHDKVAEAGVILAEYGGVPEFLLYHGYGPGKKKNARKAREEHWA